MKLRHASSMLVAAVLLVAAAAALAKGAAKAGFDPGALALHVIDTKGPPAKQMAARLRSLKPEQLAAVIEAIRRLPRMASVAAVPAGAYSVDRKAYHTGIARFLKSLVFNDFKGLAGKELAAARAELEENAKDSTDLFFSEKPPVTLNLSKDGTFTLRGHIWEGGRYVREGKWSADPTWLNLAITKVNNSRPARDKVLHLRRTERGFLLTGQKPPLLLVLSSE